MKIPAFVLVLLTLSACAHAPRGVTELPTVHLEAARADAVLEPGDFLFRLVDPNDPLDGVISGAIIQGSQSAIQSTTDGVRLGEQAVRDLLAVEGERFDRALEEGDPSAVHMAVYVGEGTTAEAFGTTPDDAGVALWRLFEDHRRSAWRVMRHRDPRVRAAIVEVARRWAAPRRIGYRVPLDVFVQDAAWGEHARSGALEFARAFDVEGGPTTIDAMFCSQFAVAVLQSAMVRVLVGAEDDLTAGVLEATLPREARIDAVASPLRVYGEWARSGAFELVAHVVVD